MKQYLDLLHKVLAEGEVRTDRTGTGTISLFGAQMRFDLSKGFPLMTTKKMFLRGLIGEMLWFISGSRNAKELEDQGINIWKQWGDPETREMGPIYGWQWRNWHTVDDTGSKIEIVDQLQGAIDDIQNNPDSRRIIVTAWHPGQTKDMALPPCHMFFQFYVHTNGKLDLQLYVRSNDLFLGASFNIAQYAALLMMVAKVTGKQPGTLVYTIGDAHIYSNHVEQVKEQLSRTPYDLPKLDIEGNQESIEDFKFEDFILSDYHCHPAIKAPVAV